MSKRLFEVSALVLFIIVVAGFLVIHNEIITADSTATSEIAKTKPGNSSKQAATGNKVDTKQQTGKHPKIVFAEMKYDFGDQYAGKDLKHVFTFHNKGDSTLIIEKVKAG